MDEREILRLRAQVFALGQQVANLQQRLARLEGSTPAEPHAAPPPPLEEPEPQAPAAPPVRVVEAPAPEPEPVAAAAAPPPEEAAEAGLELRLATTWLPRIGGVMLLIGAALGATLIQPRMTPGMRVALGYLVALLLGGAGRWVQTRSTLVGRVVIAVSLALGFFVSFAAHWVRPTEILAAPPALALMIAFVAGIVALAERWRSELTASMALALSAIAVLVSARLSQSFALIALGVAAAGAGVMLVRHEWKSLGLLALALTYLASAALWFIIPVGNAPAEIVTHLVSLLAYNALFTLALWRWGRAHLAPLEAGEPPDIRPRPPWLDIDRQAFSTSFAILNSLALSALALLLLWRTQTLWPDVEWYLGALALLEAARLASRNLSRGPLASYHAISASALFTAAVSAHFDGMTESAVLAAETLALSIAATRAPVLRLLRPLSGLCAGLAAVSLQSAKPTIATGSLPVAILLASAIPWESIWVAVPRPFAPGWIGHLEDLSGQARGLAAAAMALQVIFAAITLQIDRAFACGALALVLLAGVVLLRATAWRGAAALMSIVTLLLFQPTPTVETSHLLGAAVWIVLAALAWQEAARHPAAPWARRATAVFLLAFTVGCVGLLVEITESFTPYRGLWIAITAAALSALGQWQHRLPPVRPLIRAPEGTEAPTPNPAAFSESVVAAGSPHLLAAVLAVVAAACAALSDAQVGLLSASVVSTGFALLWHRRLLTVDGPDTRRGIFALAALVTFTAALHVRRDMDPASTLIASGLAAAAFALTAVLRDPQGAAAAAAALAVAPLCAIASIWLNRLSGGQEVAAVACGALLILASLLLTRASPRLFPKTDALGAQLSILAMPCVLIGGTVAILRALAAGPILTEMLITLSWGLTGIAILAAGFAFLHRLMRWTALGVFACAVLRILFVDLRDYTKEARAIAFFGIGLLLVLAALGYAFLRQRLTRAPEPQ